jgi:hypothetical protein
MDFRSNNSLEHALTMLTLCSETIQKIHIELEQPDDPERKADLLLTVEDLTGEVLGLLQTTKRYVWGDTQEEDND